MLKRPDDTLDHPAHDYKGEIVATIAEEGDFNPRVQVKPVDKYVELISKLNLVRWGVGEIGALTSRCGKEYTHQG